METKKVINRAIKILRKTLAPIHLWSIRLKSGKYGCKYSKEKYHPSFKAMNEKSNFKVPMFETEYRIHTEFSGSGFITKAITAIARFAFEHFLAFRVQICAQRENIKSIS
ncbi:GNAT family N-acetyltransferase [Legionella sp. PATHC035]|uniref:GNAT family N-acetyltransferase n=1 Tax=Legionella sp. PATHC035 TaxID=2992040 RepID=UPI002243365E|nr:GNAT family N-acetyltransferase [Legionella sp. PATHC035]MCW8407503.1 GNAT family N-acetyltransferase [Legionella sp. PATHC035]